MKGPGLKPVENETKGSASRLSKEGKRYTYQLHVIQQPSRARACGSGAKSSADRRPVDPPPIVELKILEGDVNDGEPKDVTFQMNANYFLFTTLVQARNLAQGRVSQEKNLTVLTGTPVAGIVYLDRPNPAGYFIFPDLSVRHEGEYRLSFSLYEQLKEDKDDDQATEPSQLSASPFEHVTHRCEVISVPFTVFSAKKFPGLTESTSLSRMVAEQGCRVRIRRDVRMRRRDTKGGKDWEGYEDETADMRARISATPEASGYSGYMEPVPRPRSSSIASHPSLAPSNSRRPSLQDIGQGYHQSGYGTVPHTPHSGYPQSSPYGVGPSPNEHYAQQPYVQQQPPMQPPPPSYHQQSYQPPPPSTSQVASSQQTYYGYGPSGNATPIPPSPYGPSLPTSYEPSASSQRMSVDHASHATDRRRSSVQYGPPPPPPSRTEYHMPQSQQASYQYPPAGQVEYPYSSQPQHTSREPSSYSSTDGYSSRPIPAEPLQSSYRTSGAHTPSSARQPYHDKLPPLNTTLHAISTKMAEPSSPYSAVPTPPSTYLSSGLMSIDSHKRSYGNVFDDRHLSQPLRQGARPSLPTYGSTHYLGHYTAAADDDTASESDLLAQKCMSYRRADGRHIQRALPPTIE